MVNRCMSPSYGGSIWGGRNKVPMGVLRDMFERAGCHQVQHYIQSGNIVFRASHERTPAIPDQIRDAIREELGHEVPVLTRTGAEILAVADYNPFPTDHPTRHKYLQVAFLQDIPTEAQLGLLDPERSPPDAFVARDQEIYLSFPNGTRKSRITVGYLDRRLGMVTSWRNWRTVLKLAEMVRASE
jgi:uncharacterized protein (DUF1697 family)